MMDKSRKNKPHQDDPKEKLRVENEIKKLKLSASHEAKFFSNENEEIPPEVESEWLDNVIQFEEQWENAEEITIADRLGHPEFPEVDGLSEKEIVENLEKVMDLMIENNLCLDTLAEVPAAELYRFIIEELFQHKIYDMRIEGMFTNFIYEEFHPNDELDIEGTLTSFIREWFSDNFRDYLHIHLAKTCQTRDGKEITQKMAVDKALVFADLYDRFKIDVLNDFQIEIDEANEEASMRFYLKCRAFSGKDVTNLDGISKAKLTKDEFGYWNIVKFHIPGFAF